MREYLPNSGRAHDEAVKTLPGRGGIFNPVNLGLYGYSFLNPIRFLDPDGNCGTLPSGAPACIDQNGNPINANDRPPGSNWTRGPTGNWQQSDAAAMEVVFGEAHKTRGREPWNVPRNYRRAKQIADHMLDKYPGHNDAGDAQRHAEWNKQMTEELGSGYAWIFGTSHEVLGTLFGQPSEEFWMDMHNNRVGREAGVAETPVDPKRLMSIADGDQPGYENAYSEND